MTFEIILHFIKCLHLHNVSLHINKILKWILLEIVSLKFLNYVNTERKNFTQKVTKTDPQLFKRV